MKTQSITIATKDLPPTLSAALRSLGYRSHDVTVTAAEQVSAPTAYGKGYRAVACMVDLATGRTETVHSSWGGANMFQELPLDTPKTVTLHPGAAFVSGQTGHKTRLGVTVHPRTFVPLLPDKVAITIEEKLVLYAHKNYKPSYRKEYYRRLNIDLTLLVPGMVAAGLLRQNKAGNTQITTLGKYQVCNIHNEYDLEQELAKERTGNPSK